MPVFHNVPLAQLLVDVGKTCCCYCITASSTHSYIGYTIDFHRRLRQHNQEIKGGARYTAIHRSHAAPWTPFFVVSGFPTRRGALQFEWHLKRAGVNTQHRLLMQGMLLANRRRKLCALVRTLEHPKFAEYANSLVVRFVDLQAAEMLCVVSLPPFRCRAEQAPQTHEDDPTRTAQSHRAGADSTSTHDPVAVAASTPA